MKPTSNKADLYHCIIDDEPDSQMSTADTDGPPQIHEVVMIDYGALILTVTQNDIYDIGRLCHHSIRFSTEMGVEVV